MRNKIIKCMDDLMQRNCICNYIIVQNGNEIYMKDTRALDAYMKAYEMSVNGNVECYMATRKEKACSPIFSVVDGVATLSGCIV